MSTPTPQSYEPEIEVALQQRADYIPLDELAQETAKNSQAFKGIVRELTNPSLRTIVGPRGCGKTHMMRYAWLECRDNPAKPFAVFASFQRYFHLEPLLSQGASAQKTFHSWVLARVLVSTHESAKAWSQGAIDSAKAIHSLGYDIGRVEEVANIIERGFSLSHEQELIAQSLVIDRVITAVDAVRVLAERKRTVLLLDDAAMALTPDYLVEFLDIVRSLRTSTIAPKVSVYPGTTEMSPRFHEGHDTVSIDAWSSVEDDAYDAFMADIAAVRVKTLDKVSDEIQRLFRFAAFGIPRAYLVMLEEFVNSSGSYTQAKATKIMRGHYEARLAEYKSLARKAPKLAKFVAKGEQLLDAISRGLKDYNALYLPRQERSLVYGCARDEHTPGLDRTFQLLREAGLIFYAGDVKHGSPARNLARYIPHTIALFEVGAFNGPGSKGTVRELLEAVSYKPVKHPLRRSISSLLGPDFIGELTLALPPCPNCGTERMTDSQKFCHSCGSHLVQLSAFRECLNTPIAAVPGLTRWQRDMIASHLPKYQTIGDFLNAQDPTADLLTVMRFGKKRSAKVVDVINSFVDDFLS